MNRMPTSISDGTQGQQVHSTCFLTVSGVVRRQVTNHRTDLEKIRSVRIWARALKKALGAVF